MMHLVQRGQQGRAISRLKYCFMYALLFSMHAPLFLPSSVTLSYFIHGVPMRKCLGQHSCMSYTFSIAMLGGPLIFFTLWIISVPVRQLLKMNSYSN